RGAGGDSPEYGDRNRFAVVGAAARKAGGLTGISRNTWLHAVFAHIALTAAAADFGSRQPDRLIAGRGRSHSLGSVLRQPEDFERAGTLLEPADIAALLERRDQPVDARLRP